MLTPLLIVLFVIACFALLGWASREQAPAKVVGQCEKCGGRYLGFDWNNGKNPTVTCKVCGHVAPLE